MCGIAGYNVSPEWARKYIGDADKMEKVLKEAWFHNIHRGHQASGFFSVGADTRETVVYKSPGPANVVFPKDIEDIKVGAFAEPVQVFGAHTREPSAGSGDPKDNVNNHPVSFDGCHVTHNGTIYNDIDIKDSFNLTKAEEKALGEVDSVVIPMLLSTIPKPLDDLEAVAEALTELRGGFAIHGIWEDDPGLSILARGTSLPLVMAQHKSGAVFYGSEVDSVYAMIASLGLKPDDDPKEGGWVYRSLDAGTFILIRNGFPMEWGAFTPRTHNSNTNARTDFYMARFLPAENGRKPETVYLTDYGSDYINKIGKNWSLKGTKKKAAYLRKNHKNDVFPKDKGEIEELAVLAEADRVYINNGHVHAFFGNVEIVLNNGRTLKDAFNHDLFDNKDRWAKLEKIDANKKKLSALRSDDLTWEEYFEKNKKTSKVTVPKIGRAYEYLKESGSGKGSTHLPGLNSGSGTVQTPGVRSYHKPEFRLSWKDENSRVRSIMKNTTPHKYDGELLFIHDPICPTHKEKFSQHDFPRECVLALQSAAYTLSCLQDLNVWWFFAGYEVDVHLAFKPGDKGKECKNEDHSFIEKDVVRVYSSNAYWEITTTEECYECGASRYLEKLPDWFSKLEVSEKVESWIYAS